MAHRTAIFKSAMIASVFAGASLTAFCYSAAAAPDDCLPGPKGTAPQGQHWYYRLDRTTKQQCWYLRGQEEKAAQANAPDARARVNPAPRKPQLSEPRSLDDARAEIPQPQTTPDQDPGTSPLAAPAIAPTPPAAQATEAAAQQKATAEPTGPAARSTNSSGASSDSAPTKPNLMAESRPGADGASAKPSGSIQMLLLVIAGAMALAGLTASIVFRFGTRRRTRRDVHRRVNWEPAGEIGVPPWVTQTHQPSVRADVAPAARRSSDLEIDRITELLEQLVRQGPTLDRANSAARSAGREQNRQGQSGVRA